MAMERNRALLGQTAKYRLRPWAMLTPDQLGVARLQLGSAAMAIRKGRRQENRHPLTAEELWRARSLAGER